MLVNQTSSGRIIINNNFIYFKQIALFPLYFRFDALLSKLKKSATRLDHMFVAT